MFRMILLFTLVMISLSMLQDDRLSQAERPLEFSITVDNVRPPDECTPYRWAITYDRTTTIAHVNPLSLTRYFVQYINHDVNLVHYWDSGCDAYVQDYWVSAGTQKDVRATGTYSIPVWTDTYEAESIEYILQENRILWDIRATLTGENGKVTDYILLFDGSKHLRIVDVEEDYGQPGGQPILEECAGTS